MSKSGTSTDIFVGPGDAIPIYVSNKNIVYGHGCYFDGDIVRSSLYGCVLVVDDESLNVSIEPRKNEEPIIYTTGSIVTCVVQKIYTNQVIVEITQIGNKLLKMQPKGIIKREDINVKRTVDSDSAQIYEYFRPGDTVRAEVVSLGDAKQFYLKTSNVNLGVIQSKSRSGSCMIPLNPQVIFFL